MKMTSNVPWTFDTFLLLFKNLRVNNLRDISFPQEIAELSINPLNSVDKWKARQRNVKVFSRQKTIKRVVVWRSILVCANSYISAPLSFNSLGRLNPLYELFCFKDWSQLSECCDVHKTEFVIRFPGKLFCASFDICVQLTSRLLCEIA
jgi:hypothetical protein